MILPSVGRIPLDTLKKLEEFARGGGVLIATRRTPLESPGFQAKESDHQAIVELSRRIFEGTSAPGRFVNDETGQLSATLTGSLRPDVELSPAAPEIGFIHRTTRDAEIYFLANTGNTPQKTRATFRVEGMEPEWWDAMTGRIRPATAVERSSRGISVALELEPYESRVVVFTRRTPASQQGSSAAGAERQEIDLSTGWQVTFDATRPPAKMDSLRSWTEDERTRYYSGPATYEKSFNLPGTWCAKVSE